MRLVLEDFSEAQHFGEELARLTCRFFMSRSLASIIPLGICAHGRAPRPFPQTCALITKERVLSAEVANQGVQLSDGLKQPFNQSELLVINDESDNVIVVIVFIELTSLLSLLSIA